MNIINLTYYHTSELVKHLPVGLTAEEVVFFPDFNPTNAPLPNGVSVTTSMVGWMRFALSDIGCGMRLVKARFSLEKFNREDWDALGIALKKNKGKLGDLGGGNHFVMAYVDEELDVYFLIHTGSRNESPLAEHFVHDRIAFESELDRIEQWATNNRETIHSVIDSRFGASQLLFDKPHNSVRRINGTTTLRKGTVELAAGELSVLPSHLSGRCYVVRAKETIDEIGNSLSHGTGRALSRSGAKEIGLEFDFEALREKIYIPGYIANESIRGEGPYAYRTIEENFPHLEPYVTVEKILEPIAYLGHL